jgi:hypothetical protein
MMGRSIPKMPVDSFSAPEKYSFFLSLSETVKAENLRFLVSSRFSIMDPIELLKKVFALHYFLAEFSGSPGLLINRILSSGAIFF